VDPLEQKITDKIEKQGPITFETFMEMALYEPGLGYYASESIEIGKAGDFYTSQHLHPIFGAMIARQIEELWEIMGRPSEFYAVEPGAGAGLMCMDIMDYLHDKEIFPSLTYVIVELNPFFREKQRRLLRQYTDKVRWGSSLKELGTIRGCILSNELLDAFPVHLVQMDNDLKEIYVTAGRGNNPPLPSSAKEGERGFSGEYFRETKGPLSTGAIAEYVQDFSIGLPKYYRTEVNLRIKEWLRNVAGILSEGFILTIDYGYPAREYYSEERNRGTLICYYGHQLNENPYTNIGKQDITAHVNFSSVKKWGEELGFKPIGFCQQGTYLISLGIDEVIADLYANSAEYLFEVAKIKRLIFPGTLGETHKVMVQYKGRGHPELRGFAIRNQMHRL
jgi:SAM-dependent MidA family methyltransferase